MAPRIHALRFPRTRGDRLPPPESLLAAGRTQVGGEIRIRIEGAPPGTRIDRVRTDNPEIPIDVATGYAMAGT